MKDKSFTLIELLVVIVIIGILAGVIMISTSSSIDKANIAKSKVFEENVQNNLAANMVSAWDADHVTKGATWILNDKWGSNNGTFYDTTSTCSTTLCPQIVSDDQMGNVLSFDGTNDYINCGNDNSLKITNKITISIWVKPFTQTANYKGIIDKESATNNGYGIRTTSYTSNTTTIEFKASNGAERGISKIVPNNIWSHIVGVYDGNNLMMYVNVLPVLPLISSTDGIFLTETSLKIGGLAYTSALNFNGLLNDIKIYNEVMSLSQIKRNYVAKLNSMLSKGNIFKEDYNQRINALAYNEYE